MNENKIRTLDLLLDFGFVPGKNRGGFPCLVLHLGAFDLFATEGINLSFVDVVTLRGFWSTGRECGEIDYTMPPEMTSRTECAAWLVYALRKCPEHLITGPLMNDWFELGKNNEHELPWVREQAFYNDRPQCLVERRWLSLALKALSESLQKAKDDECVVISFRNQILLIQCGEQVIPSPGSGRAWTEDILIKVSALRELPKRLMDDSVQIDIWDGYLGIGKRGYPIYKKLPLDSTQHPQQNIVRE